MTIQRMDNVLIVVDDLEAAGCNRATAIDYATFLDLFFPVPL